MNTWKNGKCFLQLCQNSILRVQRKKLWKFLFHRKICSFRTSLRSWIKTFWKRGGKFWTGLWKQRSNCPRHLFQEEYFLYDNPRLFYRFGIKNEKYHFFLFFRQKVLRDCQNCILFSRGNSWRKLCSLLRNISLFSYFELCSINLWSFGKTFFAGFSKLHSMCPGEKI